jgi:hypothetical protein
VLPSAKRRTARRRFVAPRWLAWPRQRARLRARGARRRIARWLLAAAPVLALIAVLAVMTVAAPRGSNLMEAWALTGRIGVAVATVMIGWGLLRLGRWL